MATKRFRELKNLTQEELVTRVRETELQLFHTRMKHKIGQLADTRSIWRLRKDIARMKTLQTSGRVTASEGSK